MNDKVIGSAIGGLIGLKVVQTTSKMLKLPRMSSKKRKKKRRKRR